MCVCACACVHLDYNSLHSCKDVCVLFSDVYLSMNGSIIPNHGYVVIGDIGTAGDDTALLCHTNRLGFFNFGGHWFGPLSCIQLLVFQDSGGIEVLMLCVCIGVLLVLNLQQREYITVRYKIMWIYYRLSLWDFTIVQKVCISLHQKCVCM